MATNLSLLLEQALAARRQSNWPAAQRLYEAAAAATPGNPQVHHNLALCLYARGRHGPAFEHAEIATRGAPQLVPAWVLRAKIERGLGEIESAEQSLRAALGVTATQPQALLELASLTLNELCDAREAERLAAPLLGDPEYDEDAQLTTLMAKLYDRDESAEEFTRQIIRFSIQYLRLPNFRFTAKRKPRPNARNKRVGLLSPLFSVSPVYFFTIGALSLVEREVDLVILNRGTKNDWGTDKFRAIAREWHDVAHLPAEALANAIYAQNLDVLIDQGGWTDPVGLKALSTKPAAKMVKWVGGQSCTTGLDVFDGFISDAYQTPAECKHLYTEPLVLLESGYVSYTPPDYMPPRVAPQRKSALIGVISNPVKLSAGFLSELASKRNELAKPADKLCFIDRRYRYASVRERVLRGLFPAKRPGAHPPHIEFVAPSSHSEFLQRVSQLSLIIDSFPYSGGLTTAEALHFRMPCYTAAGRMFSERHSLAHCYFAGYEIDAAQTLDGRWQLQSARKKSKPRSEPAGDSHAGVAAALLAGMGS